MKPAPPVTKTRIPLSYSGDAGLCNRSGSGPFTRSTATAKTDFSLVRKTRLPGDDRCVAWRGQPLGVGDFGFFGVGGVGSLGVGSLGSLGVGSLGSLGVGGAASANCLALMISPWARIKSSTAA